MHARDLAKFGELYLHDGRWAGRQVVPATWVDRSTRAATSFGRGRGYGYGWWTLTRNGLRLYAALGFGGQALIVVPKLDLIVEWFANPVGAAPNFHRIMFGQLLPALARN